MPGLPLGLPGPGFPIPEPPALPPVPEADLPSFEPEEPVGAKTGAGVYLPELLLPPAEEPPFASLPEPLTGPVE